MEDYMYRPRFIAPRLAVLALAVEELKNVYFAET